MMTVALLVSLFQQEEDGFKFKKDTEWTYDFSGYADFTKAVLTVEEAEKGKMKMKMVYSDSQNTKISQGWVVEVADGGLTLSQSRSDDSKSPGFRVYKFGAKKGDKWESPFYSKTATAEFRGQEELTVPAGKYPKALHVAIKTDAGGAFEVWLVPKVGIIKMTYSDDGNDQNYTLTKVSLPKE